MVFSHAKVPARIWDKAVGRQPQKGVGVGAKETAFPAGFFLEVMVAAVPTVVGNVILGHRGSPSVGNPSHVLEKPGRRERWLQARMGKGGVGDENQRWNNQNGVF